jgi:mRNA-degrading endonuclease HigB of HigAB toxin-antitoxin module
MNRFQHEIVTSLWKQKKYDGIREYLQVMFGQNNVIFEEYDGLRPRLFVNENDDIVLMLPTEMDMVMENAVVDSIENGTIFDDAHVVNNTAKYIRMTGLPYNGLMNKNIDEPKHMVAAIGSVVGTMDDKGRFGCDDCDVQNGVNAMKDMMDHSNDENCATMKLVGNYIDLKKDGKLPIDYRRSLGKVAGEVEKIKEVEADDTVGPDDYRELELTDECGSMCSPVEKVEEEDDMSTGSSDDTSSSGGDTTSSTSTDTGNTSSVSDESMTNGSSTESSYSDNGPDNAEVEQESATGSLDSTWTEIEETVGFELPDDFKKALSNRADMKNMINLIFDINGNQYELMEFEHPKNILKYIKDDNNGIPNKNAIPIGNDGYGNAFALIRGKSGKFKYGYYDHETNKIKVFDDCTSWKSFISKSKNDDTVQEGFFTKKPKRLKPIPRDTVAYITIELGAIKDSNDQAMLAGYTCSKLELVDFYLNCIDTQDDRYIVPHTRQYLVQLQNDLNQLLTRILQVRPRNKMDRIWKPGVTLPNM